MQTRVVLGQRVEWVDGVLRKKKKERYFGVCLPLGNGSAIRCHECKVITSFTSRLWLIDQTSLLVKPGSTFRCVVAGCRTRMQSRAMSAHGMRRLRGGPLVRSHPSHCQVRDSACVASSGAVRAMLRLYLLRGRFALCAGSGPVECPCMHDHQSTHDGFLYQSTHSAVCIHVCLWMEAMWLLFLLHTVSPLLVSVR